MLGKATKAMAVKALAATTRMAEKVGKAAKRAMALLRGTKTRTALKEDPAAALQDTRGQVGLAAKAATVTGTAVAAAPAANRAAATMAATGGITAKAARPANRDKATQTKLVMAKGTNPQMLGNQLTSKDSLLGKDSRQRLARMAHLRDARPRRPAPSSPNPPLALRSARRPARAAASRLKQPIPPQAPLLWRRRRPLRPRLTLPLMRSGAAHTGTFTAAMGSRP